MTRNFEIMTSGPILSGGIEQSTWREIDLGGGIVTLVDEDDFDFVSRHIWTQSSSQNSVRYAYGRINGRVYLLHRLIIRARPDEIVDHANRNGLDNRKANLRLCNGFQNAANKRQKPNKNGYRGVVRQKNNFFAVVRSKAKSECGPRRDSALAAAKDYDQIATRLHGEFAYLNFPNEKGEGEAERNTPASPTATSEGAF